MRLYHFTSRWHVPSILKTGELRLAESNLYLTTPDPDRALWLLDTPYAELPHGLDGGVDKREIRFTIEVDDAIRWLEWPEVKQMEKTWFDALLKVAGGMEAAEHWWISLRPISRSEWAEIAINRDGVYRRFKLRMPRKIVMDDPTLDIRTFEAVIEKLKEAGWDNIPKEWGTNGNPVDWLEAEMTHAEPD